MGRTENQKLKLLYLKELFERQSDEEHLLSMQDILDALAAQGIRAERKSVYDDILCLQQFGMDIVTVKGRNGGYFLASRTFELPELKLLVDAVQSSRFLSERKSMQLIAKLETLASGYAAGSLRRQVTVAGRVKTMNESVYYSVDLLHEAIQKNSRITFRYFDYDLNGSRRYRPGLYTASPYALCWQDENYYLIAHSERHGLTHYRVDKMASISMTGQPRYMDAQTRELDLTEYGKNVFGMFAGSREQLRLRFDRSLAGDRPLRPRDPMRPGWAGRVYLHGRGRGVAELFRLACLIRCAGAAALPCPRPGGVRRPVPGGRGGKYLN